MSVYHIDFSKKNPPALCLFNIFISILFISALVLIIVDVVYSSLLCFLVVVLDVWVCFYMASMRSFLSYYSRLVFSECPRFSDCIDSGTFYTYNFLWIVYRFILSCTPLIFLPISCILPTMLLSVYQCIPAEIPSVLVLCL